MASNWWKEAVIYQIYPSSFKDSNGDGWGDIKGIISKLDYLKELGVDIIWVSPIFKSPQADMGYDVADYKLVDARYGTNEDVDVLIEELAKRSMKLMLDLVVNHTSDQHPWFLDSKSSRNASKRDWYIWKDPKGFERDGTPIPPNNWCLLLGDADSAWTYEPTSKQYFLSLFTSNQPDLNWENEDVRTAVYDIMRFWLEKGVCGYRMDAINLISKDPRFPDAIQRKLGKNGQMAKYQSGNDWYTDSPRLHELLLEIKREVLEPYDAVTVGEFSYVQDPNKLLRVVHEDSGSLKMIFIFDQTFVDNVPGQGTMSLQGFKVKDFVAPVIKWQTFMHKNKGWNTIFLENHDLPRSLSRYCDDSDQWRSRCSKMLALMQTTLGGTIFVYQGEELGARNMPKSWNVEEHKNVEAVNFWRQSLEQHKGDEEALRKARHVLDIKSRDHGRVPMQWSASHNAGFCDENVTPWMRVNDDYQVVNAEAQQNAEMDDDLSVWQFWQRGLEHRKKHADVFVHGSFETVDAAETGNVFAYLRSGKGDAEKWIVVLNIDGKAAEWTIPSHVKVESWLIGTYMKGKPEKACEGRIRLHPWEGLLGRCG